MPRRPTLQPVSDQEVTAAIAAILRTSGPGLSREVSCYVAGLSAAHLADRLSASGYVVARLAAGEFQLDV